MDQLKLINIFLIKRSKHIFHLGFNLFLLSYLKAIIILHNVIFLCNFLD